MHSFEVNIRICQSENSDVHRGETQLNITFEGLLMLMFPEKECTNCFYMTLFRFFYGMSGGAVLYVETYVFNIEIFLVYTEIFMELKIYLWLKNIFVDYKV